MNSMKLYTEAQVKELLEIQKGNCYVAILSATKDESIAGLATAAPLPSGDQFDKMYGIDAVKLFNEDVTDLELTQRVESFKKALKSAIEEYNMLVPTLDERIQLINTLKELIIGLSTHGMSTVNASTDLKVATKELEDLKEVAAVLMDKIKDNKKLIKNYEDWSERKLFIHWKYLTHFKVIEEPWLKWKNAYKDVIL
jgi:hypothetical protein